MNLLFLLIISIVPVEDNSLLVDRVDKIEVNHYHDDNAQKLFSQLLFYKWNPRKGRHDVQAWRLLKKKEWTPYKDYATGEFKSYIYEGDIPRKVIANHYEETWTQYDPELIERNYLRKEKRHDLSRPFDLKRRWDNIEVPLFIPDPGIDLDPINPDN
jgi:hypothetical protein